MSFDKRQLTCDLFQAYYDARKNKRNTINALAFEIDYEKNVLELSRELWEKRYEISKSICFAIQRPVKREVFAADFRDRVVHHLVYNYISPLFERIFINDAYSCRIGKGTSYGVKRAGHFIRSCSDNYSRDCYVLKLDIKGYFVSMDRSVLYQKIEKTIRRSGDGSPFDIDFVLWLLRVIVFHDPTNNYVLKGKREDWVDFPKSKSLFFAGENKGLPIGNLTSQLFGNVYMHDFDCFVQYKLGCKHYGRYVDDFIIVHQDKEYLKQLVPIMKAYLADNLFLELHPKKIYLQHYSKGVDFLGTVIKPHRTYIRNRVKGNAYQSIRNWNTILTENKDGLKKEDLKLFLSGMNSYLGIMNHHNTYSLRKRMLTKDLSSGFSKYASIEDNYRKLAIKN